MFPADEWRSEAFARATTVVGLAISASHENVNASNNRRNFIVVTRNTQSWIAQTCTIRTNCESVMDDRGVMRDSRFKMRDASDE